MTARTPSDHRAGKNELARLRKGLQMGESEPEPEIKPVLATNEHVCRFCHLSRRFPPGDMPTCYECRRCENLNFTDEQETNGTH